MATLSEIGNFWQTRSGTQYERWLAACLVAAYQILNEAPETANHADRLIWANAMLSGTEADIHAKTVAHMRYAIASNATLQANPSTVSDSDIQFIVNSQIDVLAG